MRIRQMINITEIKTYCKIYNRDDKTLLLQNQ
jgi:hypothetical protein